MANVDPAFACVIPDTPAFLVWRVDGEELVPVPETEHGTFYRGDAYLVYSASEQTIYGGGRAVRGPLAVHIHFWIGSKTNVEAARVAASKAVKLDRFLGGRPVQHRETERFESPRFRSYFRSALRYLEGSASQSDDYSARMFLIRGKRRPLIYQSPAVAWEYLNDGDAFVIVTERFVFVWCGRSANGLEKIQAVRLAQALHCGRTVVVVASGEEDRIPAAAKEVFTSLLPLSKRAVRSADADSEERHWPDRRRPASEVALFVVSVEGDEVRPQLVKTGDLSQGDLVPDDVFIVDVGYVVWLWVGRRAQQEERAEGVRFAEEYMKQTGRALNVPLCRVVDGGEPAEFRSLFGVWVDSDEAEEAAAAVPALGRVAKTVAAKFDAAMLHNNTALAVETQLVDDGSGQKNVWRVQNGEVVPLDENRHGVFRASDCYVIQYCYRVAGKDRFLVYCWLGACSNAADQEAAAVRAIELDGKLRGRAVQARIVQGEEPPQFFAILGGKIIIYSGEEPDGDAERLLLHVRSNRRHATRALEVACRASSLNSNDAFVLRDGGRVFVWCGKNSVCEERDAARSIAFDFCKDSEPLIIEEGAEPSAFWDAISGHEEFDTTPRATHQVRMPARLFHCSDASGKLTVEEVADFDQSDLCEDDVMLLDAWDAVFVWVSVRANRAERRRSERAALEYLSRDPAGRGENIPVYRVHQQAEPPIFTGFFPHWDPDFWAAQPSWPVVKQTVTSPTASANGSDESDSCTTQRPENTPVFPLEALQSRRPPEGVDPSRREDFLSDSDFSAVFGMTREEFQRLPQWKKMQKKRKASLF
ncbi:advillin-like [Amphibalanus amphitrite]|uniref:advillin-like n=1 Tax=Amphibalanus amphitrite TaxID=1232801 RepID=UPI001C90822D|nr:advillin-like [Amphibalanus amphitrite]